MTIVRSSPSSALSRLDLPTFGRPTKAIAGGLVVGVGGHRRVPARGVGRRIRAHPTVGAVLGIVVLVVLVRGVRRIAHDERRRASAGATSFAQASASASRALRASSSSLSGGSAQTIASSRSPDAAPVGGGDRERLLPAEAKNSAASSSRRSLSALLTATITGLVAAAQELGRLLVRRGQAGDRRRRRTR